MAKTLYSDKSVAELKKSKRSTLVTKVGINTIYRHTFPDIQGPYIIFSDDDYGLQTAESITEAWKIAAGN